MDDQGPDRFYLGLTDKQVREVSALIVQVGFTALCIVVVHVAALAAIVAGISMHVAVQQFFLKYVYRAYDEA